MVDRTNLVIANKSDSLRTTVPSHIIKQFKLKAGDQLEGNLVVDNNTLRIVITPLKSASND